MNFVSALFACRTCRAPHRTSRCGASRCVLRAPRARASPENWRDRTLRPLQSRTHRERGCRPRRRPARGRRVSIRLHAPLRSFRARLDRQTARGECGCGSAVSHRMLSPRPARDMSGNEGSPVGASGQWYTGASSTSSIQKISVRNVPGEKPPSRPRIPYVYGLEVGVGGGRG